MARINSVQEVFDKMSGRALPEQAKDVNATVQFDVSGEGGGQWNAVAANGMVRVEPGAAANPNVTLSAGAADFLAMVNGELNPMNAFMQGKIKARGDMALLMRLQSLLRR